MHNKATIIIQQKEREKFRTGKNCLTKNHSTGNIESFRPQRLAEARLHGFMESQKCRKQSNLPRFH